MLAYAGKASEITTNETENRITPACAGKRLKRYQTEPLKEDHPCVCREKYHNYPEYWNLLGSPLRVQGKEEVLTAIERNDRITPACAGKSGVYLGNYMTGEDHPCVCREKLVV